MKEMLRQIPELPGSRPLEIGDKPLLDWLLRLNPPLTSEMTFTNLFAWNRSYPIELGRIADTLLLWRGHEDKRILLPPLGYLDSESVRRAFQWSCLHGCKPEFGRVAQSVVQMLKSADPNLEIIEDRDNADYVYLQQDLATLAGRRYSAKRNQIKKFRNAVQAQYRPIGPDLIPACLELQKQWCDERECAIHFDLNAEDQAINTVLENWEHLGVIGGALMHGPRVIALAIAEPLSEGVAVIHHEKGDTKYPGVYQAINQMFSTEALQGFEYLNREQDMGHEGLRKAKMSYQPHHMVPKFTVRYPE